MTETRFGDIDLNCVEPGVSSFHKAALQRAARVARFSTLAPTQSSV
jgi:hypothetical protein